MTELRKSRGPTRVLRPSTSLHVLQPLLLHGDGCRSGLVLDRSLPRYRRLLRFNVGSLARLVLLSAVSRADAASSIAPNLKWATPRGVAWRGDSVTGAAVRLSAFILICLVEFGPLVLGCSSTDLPPPAIGTLVIAPVPTGLDAPWSLVGPGGFRAAGSGGFSRSQLGVGEYTVTWQQVTGWRAPVPVEETKTLRQGETVKFMGVYSDATGPSVTGVLGPTADGSTLTIQGAGFGTNSLDIEWTGGRSGLIEASPLGYRFPVHTSDRDSMWTGWGQGIGATGVEPTITNEKHHSWNQSIAVHHNAAGDGHFFYHRWPTRWHEMYVTWWVWWGNRQPNASTVKTQWKLFRVNSAWMGNTVCNNTGEIAIFNRYNFPANGGQVTLADRVIAPFCSSPNCVPAQNSPPPNYDCLLPCPYPGGPRTYPCPCAECTVWTGTRFLPAEGRVTGSALDMDKWTRFEIYAKQSTMADQNILDGAFEYMMTIEGNSTYVVARFTPSDPCVSPAGDRPAGPCPISTRKKVSTLMGGYSDSCGVADNTTCQNQWAQDPGGWWNISWQNYFSPPSPPGPLEIVDFYFDDMYISFESGRARIELGDRPDWTSCLHREVQVPTAWADDRITFTMNYGGSFAPGQAAYLYVLDSAGNVSNGGLGVRVDLGNLERF
jgi:hypothetical protein